MAASGRPGHRVSARFRTPSPHPNPFSENFQQAQSSCLDNGPLLVPNVSISRIAGQLLATFASWKMPPTTAFGVRSAWFLWAICGVFARWAPEPAAFAGLLLLAAAVLKGFDLKRFRSLSRHFAHGAMAPIAIVESSLVRGMALGDPEYGLASCMASPSAHSPFSQAFRFPYCGQRRFLRLLRDG